MLIIHDKSMYDAAVSIREDNGVYQLVDSEDAILFSSTKIAHVNKALQYVTEQDASGNGILVDQIAPSVFSTSVLFNSNIYGDNMEEIKEALAERGVEAYFMDEAAIANTEAVNFLEEDNESKYARNIEERIAIGFVPENIPEGYQAMDYSVLSDYLGTKIKMPDMEITRKKYVLINESIAHEGKALYRIQALRDFGDVKAGDLGGYVEYEKNLSQHGNAWVYDNAKVYDEARITNNARVKNTAEVFDMAKVTDDAIIQDKAKVYGQAIITDSAQIKNHQEVKGDTWVATNAGELYINGNIATRSAIIKHLEPEQKEHKERVSERKEINIRKETSLNADVNTSTVNNLDFDKETKKKYIIETKEKTFQTDSISKSEKPTKSGFYYINDAEGNGFFKTKSKEALDTLFEHANKKAQAGEIITTKELARLERPFREPKPQSKEINIAAEYSSMEASIKKIQSLEQALEKERENVRTHLDTLKKTKAPENLISEAEKIYKNTQQSVSEKEKLPEAEDLKEIKEAAKQKAQENAYITYRLENKLLTRISSAIKSSAMNIGDKFMEPIRKLGELSMAIEVRNIAKDNLKLQHKIEKYEQKLERKMEQRLVQANKTRERNGQLPFPPGTVLYTPDEQQKINAYTLYITANNKRCESLQAEIIKSKEEHQGRLNYIKGHSEIARNEKIVDGYKKVWLKHEDVTPQTPQGIQATENSQSEIETPEVPIDPTFPPEELSMPEQNFEYLDPNAFFEAEPAPNVPSVPAFAPLKERFENAKTESENEKTERNANFVYHALSTKLPVNGYIEFEVNGNSYSAEKNEYGDFTMKKYSYETGRNEKLSPSETLKEFKTDTKAFETAVREQLGGVLMNKTMETQKETTTEMSLASD